jgi:hypothetical protein
MAAETDAKKEVRALRPAARPWMIALGLNLALVSVMLGYPWWRGRVRADMSIRAYVEYAACVHGGTVREAPGLSLPRGHRERFAALYVHAVPEWPASCRDALSRIPQDEAFFLLPGAKSGEAEVRAAAVGATSALDAVVEARASDRPPQIPRNLLRTMNHLAAAMTVLVEETGVEIATEHPAFDLGDGASLVEPSRIPLQTAGGGPMLVTARSGGLRVATADARSVSVVTVHDGVVDVVHVRRPAAARALIDDGARTFVGWATGDATCATDPSNCANRLTGLALVREGDEPQPELWIAAHPASDLARSFALSGTSLYVVAREADGAATVRTFALPEPWPSTPVAEGTPPTVAAQTESGGFRDVVIVEGHAHDAPGPQIVCGDRVVLFDGDHVGVTPHLGASGTTQTYPFEAAIAPPILGERATDDHARCAIDDGHISFAWLDRAGSLHLVSDVDEAWHEQTVADHVVGFAMTRAGDTITLATWGADGERQVTLRRVWHDRVLASDVAAACWDDGAGLCGPAGLATNGADTILYAREGTDLRVLRVTGSTLAALPGLGDR